MYTRTDRHHWFRSDNIPNTTLWQTYDLHDNWLSQKDDMLEWKYITGSMPLIIPPDYFNTCGGPEAFTNMA